MCIIVFKPKGVALPSETSLRNCFIANPHGAGFMKYLGNESGKIYISKGYNKFKPFYKVISEQVKTDDEAVFHFRIGTSGGLDMCKTHPFPITDDVEKLNALSITCSSAMAHNGIIHAGEEHLSDTQVFVRDILSKDFVLNNLAEPAMVELLVEYLGSDKMVVFHDKKVFMFGKWVEGDDGCKYSNDGYLGRSWWLGKKHNDDAKYADMYGWGNEWGYDGLRDELNVMFTPEDARTKLLDEREYNFDDDEDDTDDVVLGAGAIDKYSMPIDYRYRYGVADIQCPVCGKYDMMYWGFGMDNSELYECASCNTITDYNGKEVSDEEYAYMERPYA